MGGKDAGAFDAFYAARSAPLVRLIFLRTGDLTRSQDCVQEAFTRAWLKWASLNTDSDPVAWVRTVAWNLAVSDWRKGLRDRIRDEKLLSELSSNATDALPVAEVLALRDELRRLPEGQQTAIVLHYFEDMSVQEISAMTGQPAGTVKSSLHRGRLALRQALDEDTHHDRADGSTPDPRGVAR